MANKQVEFHEAATDEYLAALDWYLERSEEAASKFGAEFEQAVALVSEAPQRWPASIHGTRRLLLRRFPFAVFLSRAAFVYSGVGGRPHASQTGLLERAALTALLKPFKKSPARSRAGNPLTMFFCYFRGGTNLLSQICIAFNLHLTNFFDLSNIRFESGGPVKCLGPHDVFKTCFSNSKGTRR